MNDSYLDTQGVNYVSNLSDDPSTQGFDCQAGQSWVYPTNYSLRDYQYNIIEKALFKNTLVSLPTGLGKTFIAAVVMYNFYRWYPTGKIIFMAPTRPLVKQQMDACYNIMAIPPEVTAELTGSKIQQSRGDIWDTKRVFFITPQVLQNDLAPIVQLGSKIKCLVFDEAHKARGNHAYCEVIRQLLPIQKLFRVLALSATPGNSAKDVIDVMKNLLIAHVEFRSEESDDVKKYVYERALETVVVPLGEKLQQVKDRYLQILEKYTRILLQYKIIQGNCANITKGKIFMLMKEFQAQNSSSRTPHYNEIMKSLNICVTLYHAYETLVRCGLRAFVNFYEEHIEKPLLSGNFMLREILQDLQKYLGEKPEVQTLPNGSFVPLPAGIKYGHPKFYKLRDILLVHFQNTENSRVIVFFEYRESVAEAFALLSQSYPLIKARIFVGQGSGVTQRNQINTVKAFREGTCNTLLSTSIGEEGLDVGEVDLIVCFDIANKSPIRMIQRMGRTGRKKAGRVIVLVTEGREQQTLKDCLIYKNNLGNFIGNVEHLGDGVYQENPRLVPVHINPECQKLYITVKALVPVLKKSNIKRAGSSFDFEGDVEIVEIDERIQTNWENLWDKENPLQCSFDNSKIMWQKHLEKQRFYQNWGTVKPSKQSEIFVSLMQMADSKRFNLPLTQNVNSNVDTHSKFLRQGDIRSMFNKALSRDSQPQIDYDMKTQDKVNDLNRIEFFDELANFFRINYSKKECKTCHHLFECPKTDFIDYKKDDLSTWVQPDFSIVENITENSLKTFINSFMPKLPEPSADILDIDMEMFENIDIEEKDPQYETPRNFDKILKSFQLEDIPKELTTKEQSFSYRTPKSLKKVLNLMTVNEEDLSTINKKPISKLSQRKNDQAKSISDEFPNESSRNDIFTMTKSHEKPVFTTINENEILGFFHLENFIDFFVETSPDYSPDLFESPPKSPVLSSIKRMEIVQAKKKLFNECKIVGEIKTPSDDFDISDLCDLSVFGLQSLTAKDHLTSNLDTRSPCTPDNLDKNISFGDDGSFDTPQNLQKSCVHNDSLTPTNLQKSIKIDKSTDRKMSNKSSLKFDSGDHQFSTPKVSQKIVQISSSEDEVSSPNLLQKTIAVELDDSEDEFENTPSRSIFSKPKIKRVPKARVKLYNSFINDEAEVSSDQIHSADETSEDDIFESSFIHDTQDFNTTINSHAQYLQSVKSPTIATGKFKIPERFQHNISNVFSQPVSQLDNTYMNDSFCVTEDHCTQNVELSELEMLEKKLKRMNRKKMRKKNDDVIATKRRRIIAISDDSD